MPDPKYLSKVAIGDNTYNFKDSEARNNIDEIKQELENVSAHEARNGVKTSENKYYEADLKSATKSSLVAAAKGNTANREYAVGLDKNGNLSVNVPWEKGGNPLVLDDDGYISVNYDLIS